MALSPVVFNPTNNDLIDYCRPGETPEAAIARLTPEYGQGLIVLAAEEAWSRHEASRKTEPAEITQDRFLDMLNILPPVAWTRDGNGESFKMCERITGNITSIFVHLNERYFTFDDDIRLPHADCCARVFHSPAYRQPPSPAGPDQDAPISQGPER